MNKILIANIRESLAGDEKEDFNCLVNKLDKYKAGFSILMEYWDSLPEEEKPKINKRLTKLEL